MSPATSGTIGYPTLVVERVRRPSTLLRRCQDIFDYIEMFYDPKRRHRFSDAMSPVAIQH